MFVVKILTATQDQDKKSYGDFFESCFLSDTSTLTLYKISSLTMKKVFAFLMGLMLLVGAYSCTCTNQSVETAPVEEVVVEEDSVAVDDTLVIGAVPGEEEVAL